MARELIGMLREVLVGRRIEKVRSLTRGEREHFGWVEQGGVVLVLDDGSAVIPMRDDEGNGPGAALVLPPATLLPG